jgi:hypothetical protein
MTQPFVLERKMSAAKSRLPGTLFGRKGGETVAGAQEFQKLNRGIYGDFSNLPRLGILSLRGHESILRLSGTAWVQGTEG